MIYVGSQSNRRVIAIYFSLLCSIAGHERLPDDDDAKRQAPLHFGQRGRIPRTLDGKPNIITLHSIKIKAHHSLMLLEFIAIFYSDPECTLLTLLFILIFKNYTFICPNVTFNLDDI